MAASFTGTPVQIVWASGATPAAQDITIPSDATAVYMFWSFDGLDADGHGLASATLGGASPDQTFEIPTAAGYYTATGVAAWYNPATGSQTLDPAWDAAPVEGPTTIVVFVKDGDTTSWRDADADQDLSSTAVTVTLTTVSGDLVLKFDQRYDGSENPPALSAGWTNGQTGGNVDEGCRLSYISATGTTQVCNSENENYSSVVAISIGPAASGSDATVNGQTVTVTASVIAGSASTPDATVNGQTATVTASVLKGAVETFVPEDIFYFGDTESNESSMGGQKLFGGFPASASVDATVNGQTATVNASVIAGSVSADSGVAGQTATVNASVIAGSVSAGASVAGQTVTVNASVIAGSASATGDATVNGQTVTVNASVIAGGVEAGASVAGQTTTVNASVVAGSVSADASVAGQVVTVNASVLAGSVSADSSVAGQTATVNASVIAGSASGAGDATVAGQTLTVNASVLSGSVSADSSVAGQVVTVNASVLAGAAYGPGGSGALQARPLGISVGLGM